MEPSKNETEAMLETRRWMPPSGQMTTSGQRLLLVLEKQRAGELPLFLSEKINESLDRLLTQSGSHALHTVIRRGDVVALGGEATFSNEPLDGSFLEAQCSGEVPSQLSKEMIDTATINAIADSFLGSIENAVQKLLCDEYCPDRKARGLYADWFDEKKIATAIRLFPRVLSKKWNGAYPINWQTWKLQDLFEGTISFSLQSLSLIPLLAKLGVELDLDGRFREQGKNDYTRGGILSKDLDGINVLQDLCLYPWSHFREGDQRLCDETIATILETLRDEHLLKKENIREHDLIGKLFCLSSSDHVFPERRFRFLSDWDPTTLARPIGLFPRNNSGYYRCSRTSTTDLLPIHCSIERSRDIRAFSVVLEAGFRHYPEKLGFVFFTKEDHRRGGQPRRKRNPLHVPYVRACEKYGPERVESEVLNRIITTTTAATAATAATTAATAASHSKITPEGFLLSAVADETMDWMGLHLLVRSFPGALSQIATNMRGQEASALPVVPVQRA